MREEQSPTHAAPGAQAPEAGRAPAPGRQRTILDSRAIERAAARVAHEILERNPDPEKLVLVAIQKGGVAVANLLVRALAEIAGCEVPLGLLDVTLYRDDVVGRGRRPVPRRSLMPFSVAGRVVVLVDDVIFTGRTVRAAMDALIDFGRPAAIQVAALVDRGHRELPIRVDFVGKNIPTQRSEEVVLRGEGPSMEVIVQ
jgi:pyrimidine operon attenuation protein/uracil phosphoribosyltransferase